MSQTLDRIAAGIAVYQVPAKDIVAPGSAPGAEESGTKCGRLPDRDDELNDTGAMHIFTPPVASRRLCRPKTTGNQHFTGEVISL